MSGEKSTLGAAIYADIDSNEYLNKLYEQALLNYALRLFQLENKIQPHAFDQKEKRDILRFADILSKSNDLVKANSHKIWAQEIVILMNELYSEDPMIKLYAGDVFSSTGNHKGIEHINSEYQDITALERIFAEYRNDYLTIPAEPNEKFFAPQKEAYEHLTDECFSYSAPTSMGKSFIMRMFIKDEVVKGAQKNYALIVPTKALINEVRGKVIDDLGIKGNSEKINYLDKCNYRVVTAASDIALEEKHNFVLVLTPERLLYLLISNPEIQIDYLFIDEAHKLSGKNSRAPFYYKVVDMLLKRECKPHCIFASPNIPNPQVYLRMMTDIEAGDENKLAITYSPVVQIKFLIDLKQREIQVYNEHNNSRIHVASIKRYNASLIDILMLFEMLNRGLPEKQRKQTIVYYNGRNKAIDAARRYSDALGYDGIKNDPLLETLSKDIRQEVHGDYFLADMIRKGIAYHIGYLPASIRARIERLFQDGHITIMFCTSTLLEGVNLPADNLFITDNKIFRSEMTPVDFRNLIGRVGRISFNLFGNVYFVTDEEETVKADDYVRMLQEDVPEQVLSIATNPNVLKKTEKKYIVDIFKSGSSVIPQRVNEDGKPLQSEESYIMMRKFGLILLRDIVENKDTLVRREFKPLLTDEDEIWIRKYFKNSTTIPDDDINTSVDQTKRLIIAIKQHGLQYPKVLNGKFDYHEVLDFLNKLSNVFACDIYESGTLGKETLRKWYAVVLCQWMEGNGLNFIMKAALRHHKDNPDDFWLNRHTKGSYDDTNIVHRNIVFADTLEVIENIVLFSISNYFLRFSNEYRSIKGDEALDDNNWYEYVEYGTTNPLTILLQRNGFSRESARFIKEHPEYVVKDGSTGKLKLMASLSKCGNTSVENEAEYIRQNVPGIFDGEED
jgi:superfamily II DNA/RNA helicase